MNDERRQITIAGDFRQSVNVTNSLTNGESCSASNFSHSEGYGSNAEGKYSYAGGYRAHASDLNSFVWSGKGDENDHLSNGKGTFSLYVDTGSEQNAELDNVYINGKKLSSCVSDKFSSIYEYSRMFSSSQSWSGKNTFTGGVDVNSNNVEISNNANLNVGSTNDQSCTANFYGTSYARTVQFESNSEPNIGGMSNIATIQYVKTAINSSLSGKLDGYVKHPGQSSLPVGSQTKPVYVNSSGVVSEVIKDVVFRNEADIGDNKRFVFLKGGSISQSNATVGSSNRPIYLDNGTFVESSLNVGNSGNRLIYYSNGELMESKSNVGGFKTEASTGKSSFSPVYLSNGEILVGSGNANVGGPTVPIYMLNGSLVPCNEEIGGGGGTATNAIINCNSDGIKDPVDNTFLQNVKSSLRRETNGGYTLFLSGTQSRPTMETLGDYDNFKSSLAKYFQGRIWFSVENNGNAISSIGFNNNINPSKWPSSESSIKIVGYRDTFVKGVVAGEGSGNVISSLSIDSNNNIKPKYLNVLTGVNTASSGNGASGSALKKVSESNGKVTYETTPVLTSINTNADATQYVNTVSVDRSTGAVTLGYGKPSSGGISGVSFRIFNKTHGSSVKVSGDTSQNYEFDISVGTSSKVVSLMSVKDTISPSAFMVNGWDVTDSGITIYSRNAADSKTYWFKPKITYMICYPAS